MNKRADTTAHIIIETEKRESVSKAKTKRSVYIYIGALFLIFLLFILLSYFIQQRNNPELHTLNETKVTARLNFENLQTSTYAPTYFIPNEK